MRPSRPAKRRRAASTSSSLSRGSSMPTIVVRRWSRAPHALPRSSFSLRRVRATTVFTGAGWAEDTAAARRDLRAPALPSTDMETTVETQCGDQALRAYVAVDELSIAVRPGRVTGFVGPNGAGKTTTMHLLLGLATADSGEALIQGRRYATIARPLTVVGALLDARAFHPSRSARSHLRWLAQSNGIPSGRVGRGAAARRALEGRSSAGRSVLARNEAAPRHRRLRCSAIHRS